MTTIKVSQQTRDRLKVLARNANRTLGDYLTDIAALAERKARFAAMREAMARTTPEEWADYVAETAELEGIAFSGLDDE
jgi:predicted transcriptional regulator